MGALAENIEMSYGDAADDAAGDAADQTDKTLNHTVAG